ncbi:MAG: 3-oxoacyl-[Desulfovibrionaceae bacterium]|nr:3-oxoacyl-[acyl-carrier-protein] reductase [Desulfovibrionaceae bacterium]
MESCPPLLPDDPKVRIALVTGGSRGIGRAIAKTLALEKLHVILTYRSNTEEAKSCVSEIAQAGGSAAYALLDVADTEAIRAFFAGIKGANLFCLVNNAGITKDGLLLRMKESDFTSVLDVCLKGTFVASQEAAKLMTKKRTGRIISISSVVALMGNAGQANYTAAKAGIIGLTKTMARELAARNITCNAIAPGFIETDMTAQLSPEVKAQYISQIPLRRMGTPMDVAHAVAFLASDKAAYITGQVLSVNGGMYS